jgi:hypothetical protein
MPGYLRKILQPFFGETLFNTLGRVTWGQAQGLL